MGFEAAAQEGDVVGAEAPATEVVEEVEDIDGEMEVLEVSVAAGSCPDVGNLGCKIDAVVEVAAVAEFAVPAALSAGCGGRYFFRPSSVRGSFSLGS